MNKIYGKMEEDRNLIIDKKQVEEIKQEMVKVIEKYIDLKLRPILNYFEKKKDFYEMSFL